ncbi:FecR family protein [Rufibacter psychrotolerans]|uniref:FecR family protein n=1 Tax=Rufibacter psychrotolerans TaxID=2812556 RepID=UPI0019688FCF|nr:FecR domain-containing protein [Rufibacter sp. SYSU D00308]
MQPEKEQLEHLLDQYLKGLASEEEAILLQKWVRHLDVSDQVVFRDFAEEEKVRQEIQRNIHARIRPAEAPVRKLNPFPTWLRAVAASILLLLGLFLGDRYFNTPAVTVVASDGSDLRKVALPDGTQVTLNKYATLEFDETYNKTNRKVRLSGEAFFDVKKDSQRPFIVETHHTSTHVLGTAFNVEAYEGEEQVRVALLRGKVLVEGADKRHYALDPGQMLVYDRSGQLGTIQPVARQHIGAWLENKIIFNDIPLLDAIKRVQHLHHLTIHIDPALSLKGKKVTGEYKSAEAEQALEAILLLHNLKLVRKGGALEITNL